MSGASSPRFSAGSACRSRAALAREAWSRSQVSSVSSLRAQLHALVMMFVSVHGGMVARQRAQPRGRNWAERRIVIRYLRLRRCVTTRAMSAAASAGLSCSHTRTTVQPAARSRASVSASRDWLRAIFAFQYSELALNLAMPCSGQPCQKHPSTNTATLARLKTRSARRFRSGSGLASTRNRSPRACTARRTAISGAVSRRLLARITERAAGLDAHDSYVPTIRGCHR